MNESTHFAVHIPDEDHEAIRRLLGLRETYHAYCTATMHRISGFLRNHGHVFTQGKSTWTKEHRRWLAALRQSLQGRLQTTLATELEHLEYLETQQTAMDAELERYASLPHFRKSVEALCSLRGVKTLTALTDQGPVLMPMLSFAISAKLFSRCAGRAGRSFIREGQAC